MEIMHEKLTTVIGKHIVTGEFLESKKTIIRYQIFIKEFTPALTNISSQWITNNSDMQLMSLKIGENLHEI